MRVVSILAVSIWAGAAFAQAPGDNPQDGAGGLSELDLLSRTADDPFHGAAKKTRRPVSVTLRALNKVTARYTDLEVAMHQIEKFGSLELQPRYCDKRPPEEFPETTAFLEIFDTESGKDISDFKIDPALLNLEKPQEETAEEPTQDEFDVTAIPEFPTVKIEEEEPEEFDIAAALEVVRTVDGGVSLQAPQELTPAPEVLSGPQAEGDAIFRGWMFASSPALNGLEHPVYDVWVIDCKTETVAG